MKIKDLINYLNTENLELNLYFSRKLRDGRYISFSPNVGRKIFDDLLNLIIEHIIKFKDYEVVDYNPTGYKDSTIENCSISYIKNYQDVINSFEEADNVESEIDPDNYNFYTLELLSPNKPEFPNIKIFRRVTKFKKLHSKGFIARFNGRTLNKIESKLIGIDGEVDILIINEKIIILSHYSLERIFNLDEQFKDTASEFLKQDGLKEGINNYDNFYDDCLNDGRYRKTLTKMMSENIDIDRTYQNSENIKKTIDMFSLTINYNEEPSFCLIYEGKDQIMDILRILRDSYYKSIINEQIGVDEK